MPPLDHIHTFFRHKGEKIWRCKDPHCSTKVRDSRDLKGKASICAVCGSNEIILTAYMLKSCANPPCGDCSKAKIDVQRRERTKILEEMGIGK
jgi:hypothetical protein